MHNAHHRPRRRAVKWEGNINISIACFTTLPRNVLITLINTPIKTLIRLSPGASYRLHFLCLRLREKKTTFFFINES